MRGIDLAQMMAFVTIAERQSFTKAAAQLNTSTSALSQTIRQLEDKLGVRLLNRTTRSVAPTDIGQRLLSRLKPLLENFDDVIGSVTEAGPSPSGVLRLSLSAMAYQIVLGPVLHRFMEAHPGINVEISVNDAAVDIVKERFDAGVRLSDLVERDMIAMRVSEFLPFAVVASPEYLAKHPRPKTPHDLRNHNCIRWRLADGSLYPWRFEKRGKQIVLSPEGTLVINNADVLRNAAVAGLGIAYVFRHHVAAPIAEGRLVELLTDWPRLHAYSLYCPSRRQMPPPLKAFLEFMAEALAKKESTKPASSRKGT